MNNYQLYPFQKEAVEKALENRNLQVVYDTGTGKSIIAIDLASRLLSDKEIDNVLVICERNKIGEWVKDFTEFSGLDSRKHHGSSRFSKLEKLGLPKVLVTTYETAKVDLAKFETPRKIREGKILSHFKGKRLLVIYDEISKLSNRSSKAYKAHDFFLKSIRKDAAQRVVGLTATPIEKDWEDAFNQLRLIEPDSMPLVKEFEQEYVRFRDMFNRPRYAHTKMHIFAEKAREIIIRKRKTDPDVIEQFPKVIEEVSWIQMSPNHKKFYDFCAEVVQDEDYNQILGSNMFLRQVAGHPAALIHSAEHGSSELAQMAVEELGADYLGRLPCAKEQALLEHLKVVKDQGDKAVVFTFFGQSILPVLADRLKEAGHEVFVYHGGQTQEEGDASLFAFRNFEGPAVFLSSDSGSKGINIPEATYVVEYDSALTYANRAQRMNRIHRLTSDSPSVHCLTFVVEDTIEENLVNNMLERNEMTDDLLGDEGSENHVSAKDRRKIFAR